MFKKSTGRSPRDLACPECGTKPAPTREQVITCDRCGTKASVAEWRSTAQEKGFVGRADQPPVTAIRRERTPGGTVWHIPAGGKFGFFMFFGTFWCLITAIVSGGFLLTFLTGGEIEGNMPKWAMIPFFGIFWAIGLGTLYMGVREKWLRQRVTVGNGELVLRREMFGRHSDKRLAIADIRSVEQKEFYQKNYQPVFGIEIRASRGKLRFGSTLTPEEKAWLVADLREAIFGPQPVAEPLPRERRSAHFSVEIPNARKHLWSVAIMLMVISGTVIFIRFKFLDGHASRSGSGDPAFFAAISNLVNLLSHNFQGTWVLLMTSLMALGGLALTTHLFRERHSVKKLEGNASEIAIRTYRHGRVWKEKTFPRQEVADIRASTSGSSNGKTMKRLELIIGNKAEPLARWIDGEAADAIVAEVRAGL